MLRNGHSDNIWFFACPDTSGENAAQAIADWCAAFGVLNFLKSDGLTHFKNETIRLVSKGLKVPHHFTLPYTPRSNGAVLWKERLFEALGLCGFVINTFYDYWVPVQLGERLKVLLRKRLSTKFRSRIWLRHTATNILLLIHRVQLKFNCNSKFAGCSLSRLSIDACPAVSSIRLHQLDMGKRTSLILPTVLPQHCFPIFHRRSVKMFSCGVSMGTYTDGLWNTSELWGGVVGYSTGMHCRAGSQNFLQPENNSFRIFWQEKLCLQNRSRNKNLKKICIK